MIRKRIKKRRNPSEKDELRERRLEGYIYLQSELFDIFKHGNPNSLVNAIILYKQGFVCYDCYNEELGETPKKYWKCICEKCPHCGFRRDLCHLNIEYKGPKAEDYTKEERERVRKEGYELIPEILADNFYNDGRKYNIIPDIEYKNLNRLKIEFLNTVLQKDNIDLSGAELSYLDLSDANLSDANLSDANLSGANLSKTDLSRIDLTKSVLFRANLTNADLSGADLSGADLGYVNFTNAKITNSTNFTNARHIDEAIGLKIPNPRSKPSKIKDKHGRS